jgi:sugar-specific transcriptional regulator TrmB
MMDFTQSLKEAGLTENESKIYNALLEIGQKSAGTISRRTGLHRRVVYDTLDRLIKKGLVGYILENNKKVFKASNPKRVLEILKEKESVIEKDIPLMLNLFNQEKDKSKSETNFYKGINGLKSIFEDQLAEKRDILIIGASKEAYELMDIYFHWFDKRRQENKIKTKIIFNKIDNIPKIPLSQIKFLSEKYSSDMAINIYGDKVALILWKKENPLGILIKNNDIANGYKKHFELMWKIAKINS